MDKKTKSNNRTVRHLGGRAIAQILFVSMMQHSKLGGAPLFFAREPKSKTPKSAKSVWSSPHQGEKEKARRRLQISKGQLNF